MNKIKALLFRLLVFSMSASATYVIFELGIAVSLASMKLFINHHNVIVMVISILVGLIFGVSANFNNKGDK